MITIKDAKNVSKVNEWEQELKKYRKGQLLYLREDWKDRLKLIYTLKTQDNYILLIDFYTYFEDRPTCNYSTKTRPRFFKSMITETSLDYTYSIPILYTDLKPI